MSTTPIHSTGRGGAGNIGPDDGVYADADIVREGNITDATQAHSSGRGGTGNIALAAGDDSHHLVHPAAAANGQPPASRDAVPETAVRPKQDDFHTGRGGEGNVHREKYGGHSHPVHHASADGEKQAGHGHGLVEKMKEAVGMGKEGHKKGAEGEVKP